MFNTECVRHDDELAPLGDLETVVCPQCKCVIFACYGFCPRCKMTIAKKGVRNVR